MSVLDWIVFGFIVICGICCFVFFLVMFIGLCGWVNDLYNDTHKEELEIFKGIIDMMAQNRKHTI